MEQAATNNGTSWDLEADIVVVGSGAAGLPAAIKAVEGGASVIVVETNYDVGGHAIISGGHMALGGGTSAQKKYNIPDTPDTVFSDLTDWSIIQPNGWPDFRYNDRAVMRAFAAAGQSWGIYDRQLCTERESFVLDQRRRVGKSKRRGGNGRDQAPGGKRARQGRAILAEL